MTNKTKYMPIIGLEIHIELGTKSKMFCGCSNDWFGQVPNTLTCPVCLGLPGALPVPNRKTVEWTILLGLALNCKIARESKFDRKNYFYPDLPKGYQISQYDQPLCKSGRLALKAQDSRLKVRIRRVHMEEDTGKLVHATVDGEKVTLIDFNRSGVPLVEVVTEPDIRSSEEAVLFLKKLRQIVRYLGISDAEMEKGSMRIEPNVSIYKSYKSYRSYTTYSLPDYKVEIKNINSFKFTKQAIDYEIKRQMGLVKKGKTPRQETRGWNEKKGETVPQRLKEEAHDYRYFPEPDIPPMRFAAADLSRLKIAIPELPDAKADRFIREYSLSNCYSQILTMEKSFADYFESSAKLGKEQDVKITTIANWIVNKRPDPAKISPKDLIAKIALETKRETLPKGKLQTLVKRVLKENRRAVADYNKGKKKVLGFLIGQVVREARGKIDAKEVKELLEEQLKTVNHG